MARRYWVETLGCPKNQVDSDKLVGTWRRTGTRPPRTPRPPTWWSSTPAPSSRRPGRSRSTPSWPCPTSAGRAPPGRDRLHGRALRRRAGRGPARGRPGRRLRRAGHPEQPPRPARADTAPGPPCRRSTCSTCPGPGRRPLGLRQGGRGLRPGLRVLRHPVVPGQAAVPLRSSPSWPRSTALERRRGRAGGPGPGVLRPRHRPPGRHRPAACGPSARPGAADPAALPVSVRADRRSDRGHGRHRRARTSTCPCSTPRGPHLRRMRRWGDGERFLRRIETIRRRYPDAAFRSSFIVGYPGETEDDHDRAARVPRGGQLDWAGFFPFSPEEGTYAAGLPDVVAPALVAERLLECGELQDAITARQRAAAGRRDRRGAGRPARAGPQPPGGARDRRHHPAACRGHRRPWSGGSSTPGSPRARAPTWRPS